MGCHSSKVSIPWFQADVCSLILELQPYFHSTVPELKELLLNNQNLLFLIRGHLNNAVTIQKLLASFKLRLSRARNMNSPRFASLSADEFSSLCEHLQSMVPQLNSQKDEIKRKLSSTKKWKKVCKVLHNTVFISVLALSVILSAMSAPPVATAVAVAGSTAIMTTEKWIDSIWADRLDALKNEKDVILMMIKENNVFRVHELQSIQAMMERLERMIGSVSDHELTNQEEEIGKWINEVEMKVNACDDEIRKSVAKFLNIIISDL